MNYRVYINYLGTYSIEHTKYGLQSPNSIWNNEEKAQKYCDQINERDRRAAIQAKTDTSLEGVFYQDFDAHRRATIQAKTVTSLEDVFYQDLPENGGLGLLTNLEEITKGDQHGKETPRSICYRRRKPKN